MDGDGIATSGSSTLSRVRLTAEHVEAAVLGGAVLLVPRACLILGAGMRDPALFEEIERAVGREVVRYVS